MALLRPVKVKRVPLVSLAAKFLSEAGGARAAAMYAEITERGGRAKLADIRGRKFPVRLLAARFDRGGREPAHS